MSERERERECVYHYTTRTTPGPMLECVRLTWDIDTEQTGAAPFRGPAVHARVPSDTPQDSLGHAREGDGGAREQQRTPGQLCSIAHERLHAH